MLKDIQKTIFDLFRKEPFYALLLQEINIRMTHAIPTAGVYFDKKINKFFMSINPDFFSSFTGDEKQSIMIHELLHVLHKHIINTRMIETENKTCLNIAMDMSINQYINGLPKQCVNVDKFVTKDGKPFPKLQPFEVYYKLLMDTKDKENKEEYGKFVKNDGQSLDQHDFENLSDDEKKEVLKEMKNALQRTIEKTAYGHSQIPDFIKDLLEKINANLGAMNYKKILMQTIKKSLSLLEREHTWFKPNKKYGYLYKGTKVGQIPNAYFFIDTSGSISHIEVNEFLAVIDNFLKVGQKKTFLGKWHTALYNVQKYKVGMRLKETDLEAGGTDVNPALEYIAKKNPDLSVILTDGFFELPRKKYSNNILWVISKNGNKDEGFLKQLPGKVVFVP